MTDMLIREGLNKGAQSGLINPIGDGNENGEAVHGNEKQTLVLESRHLRSFCSLPSSPFSCTCSVKTGHDFVKLQLPYLFLLLKSCY